MSIIRISHNTENPYVMLNKKALESKKLSWAAKGLWAYLMSRPDDWNVSVSHLITIYEEKGGKEDAIYAVLNELIENGYCSRKKIRDEKGQYTKTEYLICEYINKPTHNEYEPHRAQPDLDQPDLAELPTTNKGYIINNKIQQQACGAAAVFFDCLKEVQIPELDKVWLTKNCSEDLVKRAIEWATHPTTKITTTLQQAIKWFCKQPLDKLPIISKSEDEIIEENRKIAEKLEPEIIKSKTVLYNVYRKEVEILHSSGIGQAEYIEYKERDFIDILLMKLKKYGIQLSLKIS